MAGVFTAAVFPAQADQIYKSVDAQGNVTYSDRPNAAGAKKTEVTVQQGDPKEAARLAKERMVLKAEDEQRKKQDLTENKAKAQQDQDKKAQCERARENYNTLKEVRRISKTDADGNRVYYTDEQADAMRAAALQAMNSACGA
jgi:hypothetical protein